VWPNWDAFEKELPVLGDPYFFSAKAKRLLWNVPLGKSPDVVLIFGGESTGLPPELHERYADRFVGMPILTTSVRSLNLSTAVAIALYEVIRQRHQEA
jgi:tRNA (cytidine/uridine-2'-O-)-methyltransferase